jgi:hypothetical protein
MSCGSRQRWWPTPRAPLNRGEVRSGGNLGRKPREAELTVRLRWRQWRLPNRRSGAVSGARDRPRELAARAGRVAVLELGRRARKIGEWAKWGRDGTTTDAFENWLSGVGQRGKGGRSGRV